jgi:sugar phosphate isomerase/epimerase
MKVGIDHYSYHRFFGEVYPQQQKPDKQMTVEEYIERAGKMGCDGITLESCFLPRFDKDYLATLKGMMDERHFDRVYGWGHPDGLEGGRSPKAFDQMMGSFDHAKAVGADVMKVTGASLMFRNEPHAPMLEKLTRQLSDAVKVAEKYNIKMAVENHIDFTPGEILKLIQDVNSPFLGMNFDSGNFLRLMADPVKALKMLAKHVLSTHIKDLKPVKGVSPDEWYFFACTPVGDGLVDNQALALLLKEATYTGFLAVEIDYLHPDYGTGEFKAIEKSVKELKKLG